MTDRAAIKSYFGNVKLSELKELEPSEVKELAELSKLGLAKDVQAIFADGRPLAAFMPC